MRAIVEHRCLWIDDYCGMNTADLITLDHHYYSVKAPGGSFTGLIPWVITTTVLSPISHRHEALYWALTTYLTIVLSTSLLVAIAVVLMYRLALFFGASPGRSIAIALVLPFATILFPYATEMTGEPIAAACSLAAFYLLVTERAEPDLSRTALAGFLAGWAVLCDFPSFLIAVALALYALFKLERWGHVFSFAGGAVAVGLLLMAHNQRAFGSPFFMSYSAYKLPENLHQFPEQAVGFVGLTYPKLRVLWDILIDPQRGLWFCNPVLLFTIPGLVYFARRREFRAEFLVTAFAVVGFILFNGSFGESIVSWGGGTATGPRQLVPAIPFMVLAIAFLPRGWNWLVGAIAIVSAFFMLMATSVEPHFPYEYDNPVIDFAMPAYFRGDLAYNQSSYFTRGAIVGDSVAFNLGKLARLPGWFQLWPLAALWIAGCFVLLDDVPVKPVAKQRLMRASAAVAVAILFLPPTIGPIMQVARTRGEHGLLGRYYFAETPDDLPPHIVRVDPELNFDDVAQLGALPFPSVVVWRGWIFAPLSGYYRFSMEVDDAGWLTIDGRSVMPDPGPGAERYHDQGFIVLASGWHRIEAGERNLAGGSYMHLYWTIPGQRRRVLVPSGVLRPARP
jgi:hypothetical protein